MMRILFTSTVLAVCLPVVAAAQSPEAWVSTESEVGTERGEILSRDDRPAGVASSESAKTAQRSQLQAWDLARQALLQHAPEGVPMSALELEWRGILRPRSQSRTAEPPFDPPFPVRWQATLGAERRHLVLVEELQWPSFLSRYRSVVSPEGGFDVDLASGRVTPPFREPDELLARIVRYLPPLLLAEILEQAPGSLRFTGVADLADEPVRAFSGVHRGERLDLYLDAEGSLVGWGRMVSEPMLGDAYETVRFHDLVEVAGLRLPSRVIRGIAEVGTLAELELISAAPTELDAEHLERPTTEIGESTEGETPAPTQPDVAPVTLNPGVFLFSLPENSDYRSLVIERPDHLVLVEAPVGERATRALLDTVGEHIPDKPIRWVISTHHHFDHSAGVPAALWSTGATLVTTPGNVEFFRRAVSGPRTLSGETEHRDPPTIRTVSDRWVVPGEGPATEVLRVEPTPHAAEMLAVYLPGAKLLFQGDLVRFPLPADEPLRPQVEALWRLIRARDLNVERIAGVHGDVGTVDELEQRIPH